MESTVINNLKKNLDNLLMNEVVGFISKAGFNEQERVIYVTRVNNIFARLRNPKLAIAVVGRQRSGKSTLMNALINDGSRVCPVDVITCTNSLSIISYSSSESGAFIHVDNDIATTALMPGRKNKPNKDVLVRRVRSVLKRVASASLQRVPGEKIDDKCDVVPIPRDQISTYVTHASNPDNYQGVILAEISSPSQLLKPGIVLIDSPGIDANDPTDTAIAYMVTEEVDVTIMVYSRVGNLGNTEMEFLVQRLALGEQRKRQGQALVRKVFLVQNDWTRDVDTSHNEWVSENDQVEAATHKNINKEWIRRQKGNPDFPQCPVPVEQIIRVNCKMAESAGARNQQENLSESGILVLNQKILDYYASGRIRQLISISLIETVELLDELRDALKFRIDSLRRRDTEIKLKISELQKHILDLDAPASNMSDKAIGDGLRSAKQTEINRVVANLKKELDRAKDKIQDTAKESLKSGCEIAEGRLVEAFDDGLLRIDNADTLIKVRFGELREKLKVYRKTALSLQKNEDNETTKANTKRYQSAARGVDVDVSFDLGRWFRKVFRFLGFDQTKGVDSLMQDVQKAIHEIIEQTESRLSPVVDEEIEEKIKTLVELRRSIRQEVSEVLARMSEQSKLSENEKVTMEGEMTQQLEQLAKLAEYSEQFLKTVTEQSS